MKGKTELAQFSIIFQRFQVTIFSKREDKPLIPFINY